MVIKVLWLEFGCNGRRARAGHFHKDSPSVGPNRGQVKKLTNHRQNPGLGEAIGMSRRIA